MFMAEELVRGFDLLFHWYNFAFILLGLVIGVIDGALPGFSGAVAMAVMLPVTYGLPTETGILMLMAIYCGAMYGGSIPAILIRTPGTPGATATTFDGYPMTQKGRPSKALTTAATASVIGGLLSAAILLFVGPIASTWAVKFGPAQLFLVSVLGLTVIASVASKNAVKGGVAAAFGLLLGTIGLDFAVGYPRFTFGQPALYEGIPFVVALIGLLALSEGMTIVQKRSIVETDEIAEIRFTFKDFVADVWDTIRYKIDLVRAGLIGTFIGMIPGEGASVANFLAWDQAKRYSKRPERFGTGITEGVIASEASNNAVTGGALIPTLTLGIPGSAATALLLGALMIHGVRPGPGIFTRHGDVIYALVLSLFFTNLLILVVGLFVAKYASKIVFTPTNILGPVLAVLTVIGSFALRNSVFDILLMLFFGLLGYMMQRANYPAIAALIGLILGPMAEHGFTMALDISRGSYAIFFAGPVSIALWLLIGLSLLLPIFMDWRRSHSSSSPSDEASEYSKIEAGGSL